MSNDYRKVEPERVSELQVIELGNAAIQKLFEAKGGLDIELQIKVMRLNLENALACRAAEAVRLKENPGAMREKGERPIVTVSEDRLHSREMTRLMQMREELRLYCRTLVNEVMTRRQPVTLEEVVAALEFATRDVDNVGAMLGSLGRPNTPEQNMVKAALNVLDKFKSEPLPKEVAESVLAALKQRNAKALLETFTRLPQKFRDAFDEEMRKLSAA